MIPNKYFEKKTWLGYIGKYNYFKFTEFSPVFPPVITKIPWTPIPVQWQITVENFSFFTRLWSVCNIFVKFSFVWTFFAKLFGTLSPPQKFLKKKLLRYGTNISSVPLGVWNYLLCLAPPFFHSCRIRVWQ